MSHRISARPKTSIPEFLENAQTHCLMESLHPEIYETCTESLCHLKHRIENIWKSRGTSVRHDTPGPEFLDQSQNFCVAKHRRHQLFAVILMYYVPGSTMNNDAMIDDAAISNQFHRHVQNLIKTGTTNRDWKVQKRNHQQKPSTLCYYTRRIL
jgi:hypothetical protein